MSLLNEGSYVAGGTGGGGSGLTSVGLTMPSRFGIANSPLTSNGTIVVTDNSETQNLVLASPNGSAGVPVFRALVAADLPVAENLQAVTDRGNQTTNSLDILDNADNVAATTYADNVGGPVYFGKTKYTNTFTPTTYSIIGAVNFEFNNNGFVNKIACDGTLTKDSTNVLPNVDNGVNYLAHSVNGVAADSTGDIALQATGWSPNTAAVSRADFDAATVTLTQLAQRVAALIQDLESINILHS